MIQTLLYLHLSIFLSVCTSISSSIYLSIFHLSIYLSICLSIYIFIYLYSGEIPLTLIRLQRVWTGLIIFAQALENNLMIAGNAVQKMLNIIIYTID